MYTLTEEQIDFILRDIKSRGVEMEDLQISLLDHICCIMECELEPDGDFESFYRKTIPRFFNKELSEIEEETILLLTFKHYYAMKKTMIVTGAVSTAFFITGSLFKIMHWPGASALLVLAIFTISFVFFPLLFVLKTKEAGSGRDKIILIVGTVFGIIISMSTLFKVMHWPWANNMWLISLGVLFFIFIPMYFFSGIRNPDTKINTITSSILMIVGGGLLFTLTSLGPNMMNAFTFPDTLVRSMNQNIEQNNIALYEKVELDSSIRDKSLKVKELSDDMSKYISQLKMYLLTTIEPEFKDIPEEKITLAQINFKDNWSVPTSILIGNDPLALRQDANSAAELKKKIIAYRTGLLDLLDENEKKEADNCIGLNIAGEINGSNESWESIYFYHNPIVAVIAELNQLQNEVSYAELVTLTKLIK